MGRAAYIFCLISKAILRKAVSTKVPVWRGTGTGTGTGTGRGRAEG